MKSYSFIPLVVLTIVISVILVTPLRIIAYGYLPPDDALRHCAKVISGKEWSEILVLREGISMDSHPGWHSVLGFYHKITNADVDDLVVFSIVVLFFLFSLLAVFVLARPEAWLIALGIGFLLTPHFIHRLLLARPYIFTMAILSYILLTWHKLGMKTFPLKTAITFTLLIALSTWIHCSWYLFSLLILCFFLARQYRIGLILAIISILGIGLGAIFTGQPVQFFNQTINHLLLSFGKHKVARQLVGEFQPFSGDVLLIMAILAIMAWRYLRGKWDKTRIANPTFMLIIITWILGFRVQRFWLDLGMPAVIVWVAQEFQDYFETQIDYLSFKRLILTSVVSVALFISTTADFNSRWTTNLAIEYLSSDNPEHAELLPQRGGILYTPDMNIFYQTFFKNPRAEWKYILGFEATWMPEQDLKIYRNIQLNPYEPESYLPWVKKMSSKDRLIIKGFKPQIKELNWQCTKRGIWVGMLKELDGNS